MHRELHSFLVSVNIITHNRGTVLINAIESALNQSYKNLEIIVVDDGSTDNTAELISPFLSQITYIKLPKKGVSYCRQYAKKISRGEYFAFLDSDDVWLPSYIEKSMKIMLEHNLDLLFNRCKMHGFKQNYKKVYVFPYQEIRSLIIHQCPAPTSGMIIKKGSLKSFKWKDRFGINEDWHLQISLVINNFELKVGFNPKVMWIKNEDENTFRKLKSLKYITDQKQAYIHLYTDLNMQLSWIEKAQCWLVMSKHNVHFVKRLWRLG